jgi:hypothetical protein
MFSALVGMFRHALNVATILLATVGLCHTWDTAVGDGALPTLRRLPAHQNLAAYQNTTPHMDTVRTPDDHWRALQPTLRLLRAVSPEIHEWVISVHAEKRLAYTLLPIHLAMSDGQVLAAYDKNDETLRIGTAFWQHRDGDKAAFLIHEYRHYRQNRAKVIGVLLAKLLSGRFTQYPSALEDEAFLYQHEAYQALGLPSRTIEEYLEVRDLVHAPQMGL